MKTSALLALAGACALATTACGSYASYVETDDTVALGRVVVYRNGIAYYERAATVEDGKLTMTVPHDKVDDFLKSLTVRDAKTGKTLPVSFPTSGATADGKVDMTVQIADPGPHDVVLTYITESPAWKPSYRVMVEGDEVKLQGWAIVDNTSGEKWDHVRIGVGSSSALSFRYDLRSVRLVHRETLSSDERFAVAPPTGRSAWGGRDGQTTTVIAALDQSEIPSPAAAPAGEAGLSLDEDYAALETVTSGDPTLSRRSSRSTRGTKTKSEERADEPNPMPRQQLTLIAEQLKRSRGEVIIEGYADAGERDAELTAGDRANWLRNELIAQGIAPARLKVDAKGAVAGHSAGVRLVRGATPESGTSAQLADGDPIGESHFQSDAPVTVDKGTSAMIAILDDDAQGSIVYLYDAESERGNDRYAFKAIRFKNPTDSTLETGPMTVYGEGRFIGEGLSEPIPPHATALVPFALDRQIIVEREGSTGDRISSLLTLQRGVLRTEVQHRRTTKLKITSALYEPTEVYVRHSVRKGWKLIDSPELFERQGESHIFKLALAPGESQTIEIVEATPLKKTINIRTPQGVALVRAYLGGDDVDARFAEPMAKLLLIYSEMADTREAISMTRDRLAEFRARMSELQRQIVSLDGVRGGKQLLRHLRAKLQDMSERIQRGTIEVVNLQERLMLSHIRFQDGVSELSLDRRVSRSASQPTG